MRTNMAVTRLTEAARRERRCLYPSTNTERKAIYVRVRSGAIIRVHRNVYAEAGYWTSLEPPERAQHVIKTLSRQFPRRVFASVSAAAVLGLEYPWGLHADDMVCIATRHSPNAGGTYAGLQRIAVPYPDTHEVRYWRNHGGGMSSTLFSAQGDVIQGGPVTSGLQEHVQQVDARGDDATTLRHDDAAINKRGEWIDTVRVTSPARTLVDCALRYPFRYVLPMFDSALRRKLVVKDMIVAVCDGLRVDCGPVLRLLHYADPRSENGGESFCRGTIIEEGFAVPGLQYEFLHPDAPQTHSRVDFIWHTEDGRVIVLEYDGARKYVDPAMTNHRDVQAVVHAEREREEALRRAGVTCIVRVTYDEVLRRAPLALKLSRAGVPRSGLHPLYARAVS